MEKVSGAFDWWKKQYEQDDCSQMSISLAHISIKNLRQEKLNHINRPQSPINNSTDTKLRAI